MISLKKSIVQTAAACILSLSVFAQGGTDSLKTVASAHVPQKTCPVMGGDIDKSVYADYEGKRVYFCCGMCVDTFKKDPVKYIKKIEAMGQEADNIPTEVKKEHSGHETMEKENSGAMDHSKHKHH